MAKLGGTMQSVCCLIIIVVLVGEGVSGSGEENKGISGGASTMLRASSGNNKAAFVLLTKAPIPPSGPSHRGHPLRRPHLATHLIN
ncbi:hypothetical protein HN51_010458 [Arachis hypogaea]